MAYDMSVKDDTSTSPAFGRSESAGNERSSVHSAPTSTPVEEGDDSDDVVHICKRCMTARPGDSSTCPECGEPLVPIRSVRDSYLGETVGGKYRLVEQIGAGGMGEVYLGINEPLDQRVAVKFLSKKYTANEQVIMRFLNEARSYCKVNHPNAVTLLDYGQHEDGALYIITEYIDGVSLTDAIEDHGALDPPQALSVAMQCAEVLSAAHEQGVIHRDLKPDNLMLIPAGNDRYAVKVLDFGIAKIVDDERPALTETGSVFGTPEFMSPEQAEGKPADPRSDLYALGIILFYASTARLPFDGQSQFSILEKQINEAPPKASSMRDDIDVPDYVEAIIERCLQKERDDRYASADALLEVLERTRSNLGSTDSSPSVDSEEASADESGETVNLTEIVEGAREESDTHGYPAGFEDVDVRAETALASNVDGKFELGEDFDSLDLSRERERESFSFSGSGRGLLTVGGVVAFAVVVGAVVWQVWSSAERRDAQPRGERVEPAATPPASEASKAEKSARSALASANEWLDEATLGRAKRKIAEARQLTSGEPTTTAFRQELKSTTGRRDKISAARSAFVTAIDKERCSRADTVGDNLAELAPGVADWVEGKVGECRAAEESSEEPTEPEGTAAKRDEKPEEEKSTAPSDEGESRPKEPEEPAEPEPPKPSAEKTEKTENASGHQQQEAPSDESEKPADSQKKSEQPKPDEPESTGGSDEDVPEGTSLPPREL